MAPSTAAASEPGSTSDPSGAVQLLVRNIDSRTTVIRARLEDTLDSVLNRIAGAMARTGDLRVVYAGRELPLEATIGELRLPWDATIQLTSRLRSTRQPDAWNLASGIITAGRFASTGIPVAGDAVEKIVRSFLNMSMAADRKQSLELTDPVAECLEVFLRSGSARMLVHCYLSAYAPHRAAAERAIRYFLSPDGMMGPRGAKVWTAPVLIELCRSIDAGAGKGDRLYGEVRGVLATVLSTPGWTPPRLPDVPREWVAEQVIPFAEETARAVMHGIVRGYSSTATERTLFEFRSFSSTLRHEVRELRTESTPPRGRAVAEYMSPWRVTLSWMLKTLLECIDGCMERFEIGLLRLKRPASSRAPPKWTASLYSVWVVLIELEAWSWLEAWPELHDKLRTTLTAHHAAVTALVVGVERTWTRNIRWIARHRDILGFDARRHLAMAILPEVKTDIVAPPPHMVLVHRWRLLVDSFKNIANATRSQLHSGLFVEFKHEAATGPGVMREWFCLVCQGLFNPHLPLFSACPQDRRRFFLNPESDLDLQGLKLFVFAGRMIGLALMHKIQVGVFFDRTLFLQLAERPITLNDIADADPSLHASCKKILEMDASLVDSDALGLTFSREVEVSGSRKSIEFFPGGKDVVVTSTNIREYIRLLIQDTFVNRTRYQLSNFSNGFSSIFLNWEFTNVFFDSLDAEDFDQMLGGSKGAIDVQQWRAHTEYSGYRAQDCQLNWFWKAVESMTTEQQRRLFFFWTAVKYLPFDGFSGLRFKLCIFRASGSCDHLPTSHTCFYQLDLPAYTSFDMMQSRLQVIVQEHVSSSFGES